MRDVKIKVKERGYGLRALAFGLIVTLLLSFVPVPTAASEADASLQGSVIRLPDFTDPNGTADPIPQGDVVAALLGSLSEAEINYLNAYSQYTMYASMTIPDGHVYTHLYGEGVWVQASAYTYTTAAGAEVSWIPLFAMNLSDGSMADLTYDETKDLYIAQMAGTRADTVEVWFAATVSIPEDTALTMINEAPAAAEALVEAWTAYEATYADWAGRDELYREYQAAYTAWAEAKEAYDAYMAEKEIYDAWWADYELKKANAEAYEEQLAAYERWVQYWIDLENYEAYMSLVHASPELKAEYEAKMRVVFSQLEIMDRMFIVSDISGYSFEGVLNSGAADYVINNDSELMNIHGVKEEDVRKAVSATLRLRELVDGYKILTDNGEQYDYYIANREEMISQLNLLYDCMKTLGEVEGVMYEISARDGLDAYLQFLGNLYVQSRLMDDTLTLDADHVLLDRPLESLIEPSLTPADTNDTTPLAEGYPQPPYTSDDVDAVPFPGDPPPEVEEPAPVDPVPDLWDAPAKPEEVPPAGEKPEEVPSAGEAPAAPAESEEETALRQAAMKGEVPLRTMDMIASDGTVSLLTAATSRVQSGALFGVTFINTRGTVHAVRYVTFGSSLEGVISPPPASANGISLEFVGWSMIQAAVPDTPGQPDVPLISLDFISREMTVYPVYRMPEYETEPPAHVHEFGAWQMDSEAQHMRVCACGEKEYADHVWDEGVVSKAATHAEAGVMAYTCTVCGADKEKSIPVVPHTFDQKNTDDRYLVSAATCTETAVYVFSCACGEAGSKTFIFGKPAGHSYTNYIYNQDASCTADGTETARCDFCDESNTRTKSGTMLAHTWQDAWLSDGEGHYRMCAHCTATTQKESHASSGEATESNPEICTTCAYVITPALGHTHRLMYIAATDPTCTEAGNIPHYLCTGCGKMFGDDQATQEFVAQEQVQIPAQTHRYLPVVTDPTCTEGGYTTHTCTRCEDSYVDSYTEAKGHTEGDSATCTENQICTVCGEIMVEMLGHEYHDVVTHPTCTEGGYTTHTCIRCEDSLVDSYTEAKGHTGGQAATCTEDQTCTECGETVVEQLGHQYLDVVTDPTCTEEGYTSHTCTRCEDHYIDYYTEAKGHTGGQAATCTEDQICTECGEMVAERLGHEYHSAVTNPTCTEKGYTTHACTRCEDSYTDAEIPATGHTPGDWIITNAPAQGVEGSKQIECTVCHAVLEKGVIEALPMDTQAETDSETDGETEPETDRETEPETDEETELEADGETEPTTEAVTLPTVGTPQVKWYAKLLGTVGLPGLVTMAGAVMGLSAAGIVVLITRLHDRKRKA